MMVFCFGRRGFFFCVLIIIKKSLESSSVLESAKQQKKAHKMNLIYFQIKSRESTRMLYADISHESKKKCP